MLEQLKEQMSMLLDIAIDQAPKIAKVYKTMYDALIEQGFPEEQAMKIVYNYNPTGK